MKIINGLLAIFWASILIALFCGYNPDKFTIGISFFVTTIHFTFFAFED